MGSAGYWFIIRPLGAVVTVAIAFTLADGIARWVLLGIAVLEVAPLLLAVAGFLLLLVGSTD